MKPITIQSGIIYEDGNSPGWTLNKGNGNRYFRGTVKFAQPFEVVPQVLISFENEEEEGYRIPAHCNIEKVGKEEFTFVFRTWGNNKIHALTARWVAMAQNTIL